MLGAITGDVVGSVYESYPVKDKRFPLFTLASRFTDDTVLTAATASVVLDGGAFGEAYVRYFRVYPDRGYGERFSAWADDGGGGGYKSFGNGAAVRVSPVAWAGDTLEDVLAAADATARVTHDHPDGIRGAKAVAGALFLARKQRQKEVIRDYVEKSFGYDLHRDLADIQPDYDFDMTCQGSVPEALIAFLDSTGFEDALRNAVSLGGDADTQAAIAGSVAEAFYGGVPEGIAAEVLARLPAEFVELTNRFLERYCNRA